MDGVQNFSVKAGGDVILTSWPEKIKNLMCSMSVHYIIQNINHPQMHKESYIVSRNTLLTRSGPDRGGFTPPKTTQYTANSTFSLNYKVQP
jgi:hypothetical protein